MSSNQLPQVDQFDLSVINIDRSKIIDLKTPSPALKALYSKPLGDLAPRAPRALKQLTLHQLQLFEATARHRSFTRAAKELFLTQPTVSLQVKQLADAIGMPLFAQVGKQVFLTDAGKELLKVCYQVFQTFTQLEMQLSDLQGMNQGHLKIAAISPINTFISQLLNPYCYHYPGINVSVDVMNSERILRHLAEHTHDLYLMCEPPADPEIESQVFVDNPLVVVAAADHPLAAQSHLPMGCLNGERFIMREVGSATRRAVQALLTQHDVSVRVQLEVSNNEAIKQMVIYGLGISVLSYHMVEAELAAGQLAILDIVGFPIERHWYAVYPASKQLAIAAKTFLHFLKTKLKSPSTLAA